MLQNKKKRKKRQKKKIYFDFNVTQYNNLDFMIKNGPRISHFINYPSSNRFLQGKSLFFNLFYRRISKFRWLLRKRNPGFGVRKMLILNLVRLRRIVVKKPQPLVNSTKALPLHPYFINYHGLLYSNKVKLVGDVPSTYNSNLRADLTWKIDHLLEHSTTELIKITPRQFG
jgi:hypothetical protein